MKFPKTARRSKYVVDYRASPQPPCSGDAECEAQYRPMTQTPIAMPRKKRRTKYDRVSK